MIEASAVSRELPAKPNDKTVLSHYSVTDSGYDEMYSAPGELRPHWRHMARFLEETGSEELARRQAEIQRLLQSDGVTYMPRPMIRLRSPSPSEAAPKSGASAAIISS